MAQVGQGQGCANPLECLRQRIPGKRVSLVNPVRTITPIQRMDSFIVRPSSPPPPPPTHIPNIPNMLLSMEKGQLRRSPSFWDTPMLVCPTLLLFPPPSPPSLLSALLPTPLLSSLM